MPLSNIKTQCGATAKRSGQRCQNPVVIGYQVCHKHGAGSPRTGRPGGRPIVHGRYSQYAPTRLAERYEEALGDPELLQLHHEAGLLVARNTELLQQLTTAQASPNVENAYADLQAAIALGDATAFQLANRRLGEAIAGSSEVSRVWNQLQENIRLLVRVVGSERQRLIEQQQMITTERLMILIAALVDVIRKHEPNPTILAAISADIRGLLSHDAGRPAVAA